MPQQHVEIGRKLMIRRAILRRSIPGPAYVPFLGDGDIARELYRDRTVYGADIDADRVFTASMHTWAIPPTLTVADCDQWPFLDPTPAFAVADFDAYAYPYDSFRAFWEHADKLSPLALFFTDGQKQTIKRAFSAHLPDGSQWKADRPQKRYSAGHTGSPEFRQMYNFYWTRQVQPWLRDAIGPDWKVAHDTHYLRGGTMLYWGALVVRKP